MCNIGAVTHWCFDFTNKCHSNYPIGHMDWIGLDLENWTHVQLWSHLRLHHDHGLSSATVNDVVRCSGSSMDVRSYGDRSPGPNTRRDGYLPTYEDYELRFNRAVSPAAPRTGPATAPRLTSAGGGLNHRLTRKMSADSLVAYRTYQPDSDRTTGDITSDALRAAAGRVSSAASRTSSTTSTRNSSSAAFNGNGGSTVYSTMTLSRAQQLAGRARTPAGTSSTSPGPGASGSGGGGPATAAKLRSLQLARKPLQIQTESFRPCQATGSQSVSSQSLMGPGVSGTVMVHIYCAHGLRSTSFRTTLRDLYCVVEIDAVSRARTMVRTGAINFDWDEAFDVDLDAARRLSFLVYSWDPHVRHRLCFSGVVPLSQLMDGPRQRLAVALEPKGVLYVELDYRDAVTTLRRTPAVRRDAVFGVALGELVARERSTLEVPAVLQRCVEEVERRGMDHVGIYRLCGSAKRKQQLREELERDPLAADLSPDAISDINVVTSKSAVLFCYKLNPAVNASSRYHKNVKMYIHVVRLSSTDGHHGDLSVIFVVSLHTCGLTVRK